MQKSLNFSPVVVFILVSVSISASLAPVMASTGSEIPSSASAEAKVHIVYTERPEGQEPEAYNIKTLSSVLGSEDAAKEALVYHYKHAASGFSAKLTPEQVSQLSKKPGVLQVVPSQTLHLHSGPGKMHV